MHTQEEKKFGEFIVVGATGLLLTYEIPKAFYGIKLSSFWLVPMRKGKITQEYVALFIGFCAKPLFPCQNVISPVEYTNSLPDHYLAFLTWIAEYYLFPLEKVVPLIAPKFLWNAQKHTILFNRMSKFFKRNDNLEYEFFAHKFKKQIKGEVLLPKRESIHLTTDQNIIYNKLLLMNEGIALLHGVTGSGKTEIYIKLSQDILNKNKTVLVLVPEITLTPQMTSRFRAVFGNDLAIVHSGLTQLEYELEWFKIHLGFAKIVLGVRTAIFSFLKNIGLIIIDEEHDNSYKSQDSLPYHARDLAIVRAKKEQALCLLGSATPSVESMYNVYQKKYEYFKLDSKYSNQNVENIIIDSRKYIPSINKKKLQAVQLKSSQISFSEEAISPEIYDLLQQRKKNSEQSIIIINRRGYVNFAICTQCASPLRCPNCAVTTTLHEKAQVELCHYCGYREIKRKSCPSCHSHHFIYKGVGTQQIEDLIQRKLPELKIARLDRDVLTSNTKLSGILEKFRTRETDCLIGTQMLAKGHDFPFVTLVVVLHVEDALYLPDFRSAERTFQLLNQAMGRAARGTKPGTVVLQSLSVGHPVIEMALKNSVEEFIQRELKLRKFGFHPPYSRQILLEVRSGNKEKVEYLANKIKHMLIQYWQEKKIDSHALRLAGPYNATIEKINQEYRMQLCISTIKEIHPFYIFPKLILADKELIGRLRIDVDPFSFL